MATDGHRLARMDVGLPEGGMGMPGIILPRKTVQELAKLLADHGDTVAVELSANKIRFTVGNVVLTSKLIDGTFPDYQRVVPQGNDKIMRVDNARLHQCGGPRFHPFQRKGQGGQIEHQRRPAGAFRE